MKFPSLSPFSLFNVFLGISVVGFYILIWKQRLCLEETKVSYHQQRMAYERLHYKKQIFQKYQKDIRAFLKKNWSPPSSRLKALKCLENLKKTTNGLVSYVFSAEQQRKSLQEEIYQTTKISFLFETLSDDTVYCFIIKLLDNFPGVLIFRELTLSQTGEGEKTIQTSLTCEWVYKRKEETP